MVTLTGGGGGGVSVCTICTRCEVLVFQGRGVCLRAFTQVVLKQNEECGLSLNKGHPRRGVKLLSFISLLFSYPIFSRAYYLCVLK